MNLDAAVTETTVDFCLEPGEDRLEIDGTARDGATLQRVSRHLDLIRRRGHLQAGATVTSANAFPMATGIASSASGFAALTIAACAAAGLDLPPAELSALARRGSGSAARSVPGGFVEWFPGTGDTDSFARTIAPSDHWDLRDVVVLVSRIPKALGSTDGHTAALASPLFEGRLGAVDWALASARRAIAQRDLERLGDVAEAEALSLHAIAMTGRPSALYWAPQTLTILHAVRAWRRQGLGAWFTLDAGPNVHILCEGKDQAAVLRALRRDAGPVDVIASGPGGPAVLL
jgi:diphosphomevalonate decarboxylase